MDDLVIDQPTEELDIVDQPGEVNESEQAEYDLGNQDSKPQTESEKLDGRRFNPEWSKALKELRELYPDKADMLTKMRDNYARYQALQEVAPKGLEDVRAWKSTLDALGGSEAAADLMQRVADVEAIDSRIESGDYAVISELPESMQKGIYQMLPEMLADLSAKDQQAFSAAVAPHFQTALAGTGLGDALKEMYTVAGDNQAVKDLIQKTYNWFQQQTSGAGKIPGGTKTVSPEVARLQAELSSRQAKDDESFIGGVTAATETYVADAFTKNAEVYLKQLKLTDAQKSDLQESFGAKLTTKLGSDAAFQKQLGAYKSLKNRNPDQVNTYIRSKIDESAKGIIDGLVTARYGGQRAARTVTASGTTTTEAGVTRVAQAPDQSQWDMAKMEAHGYENTVKKGLFFLQGGRSVQLARPN